MDSLSFNNYSNSNKTVSSNQGTASRTAKFSLDTFKPKKDTTHWNEGIERLAFAHHKFPKSALVWLYEHLNQNIKKMYHDAFDIRKEVQNPNLSIDFDKLIERLDVIEKEREESFEKSVNRLPEQRKARENETKQQKKNREDFDNETLEQRRKRLLEERDKQDNGGVFLARLTSNLIAAHQIGSEMHSDLLEKEKVKSSNRVDDPHNNRDFTGHEDIEGIEVVRDEEGQLTPRSEVYLDIAKNKFNLIYDQYRAHVEEEQKKINKKLPLAEVKKMLDVIDLKGGIELSYGEITLDWLKNFTEKSDYQFVEEGYRSKIKHYESTHDITEGLKKDVDIVINKLIILNKDSKIKGEKTSNIDNGLTENDLDTFIKFAELSGQTKFELINVDKNLLKNNTDNSLHQRIDDFYTLLGLKSRQYSDLKKEIEQSKVEAQEAPVKGGKKGNQALKAGKEETAYTAIINKIKSSEDSFIIDDNIAKGILESLLKAEQLHEDIEYRADSKRSITAQDEEKFEELKEFHKIIITDEEEKLKRIKASYPSHTEGLFKKVGQKDVNDGKGGLVSENIYAKMPAKKIIIIK